jgi:hypothetical protein
MRHAGLLQLLSIPA